MLRKQFIKAVETKADLSIKAKKPDNKTPEKRASLLMKMKMECNCILSNIF
jgi:hypothetical protein